MGIIIAIMALGIVIVAHEFGHMMVAKKAGVGVYEFSIGFGPRLWSKKFRDTVYSLRLLPFGGFVKLAGMDDEEDKPAPKEVSFEAKSVWVRSGIIAAGSLTNILFGFLIFCFFYGVIGIPELDNVIQKVAPASPAAIANLQAGDIILQVGEGQLTENVLKELLRVTETSMPIMYQRDNETFRTEISRNQNQKLGILFDLKFERQGVLKAVIVASKTTYQSIYLVFQSLYILVSGQARMSDMAGPIGLVQLTSFQYTQGLIPFLNMIALISVSLGVINLLPIPLLDGGFLFFLMVEVIRKKAVSKRVLTVCNNVSAFLLISLSVIIWTNDVVHWQERVVLFKNIFG
ncbi:hypothetical protein HOC37_06775 [bacterium]|jgi:regulator of sigma E protease|nr:hypothetical protein [bacterium]MBT3581756.1 hypothetical protein [bacterium]MBT4552662.1 hypothetical protein [bacterium]MBT5988118.1 hypothetical protein [bacterium]MBT7087611.1 hypothetical protein [bacterium]